MDKMETIIKKFFENMKSWVEKIIPQETKNCLRTKFGTIVGSGNSGTVNVRLLGSKEEDNEDLQDIKISGDYKIGDTVIIGYVNNSLTNSFVLFNLSSTGTKKG